MTKHIGGNAQWLANGAAADALRRVRLVDLD